SQKSITSTTLLPLAETPRSSRFFAALVGALSIRQGPGIGGQGSEERELGIRSHELQPRISPNPESRIPNPEPEWAAQYSGPFPGWEFFVPLVEPHSNSLFSLLDSSSGLRQGSGARDQGTGVRGRGSGERESGVGSRVRESQPSLSPNPAPRSPSPRGEGATRESGSGTPALLVWDEKPDRIQELRRTLESLAAAYDEVRDIVPARPRPEDVFLTEDEFLKSAEGAPQLSLKELGVRSSEFGVELANSELSNSELFLPTEPAPKFHGAIKAFIEDVKSRLAGGERVAFVMPTAGKVERLREILKEYEIPFTTDESEVGSQKSEVRSQKSEPRKSETEIGRPSHPPTPDPRLPTSD